MVELNNAAKPERKIHAPSLVIGMATGIILLAGGYFVGSASKAPVAVGASNNSPGVLMENTVADIAESVSKSVVNIDISQKYKMPVPELFFYAPPGFKMPGDNAVEREAKKNGSGIIIREDGYIATNNHVVGSAEAIKVTLSNSKSYAGKVVGRDPFTDLAVIKIDARDLPVAKLGGSKNLRAGDWAIAIGSPMGLDHTVTLGIVSALGRSLNELSDVSLIQTDAAINPGNSGGPLLDIHGNIIGLNTAIKDNAQNIGFAIPVDLVKAVSDELIAKGKIARPYVGIMMQELDSSLASSLGLEDNVKGIAIGAVKPGSPAEAAGIERGDVLQRIEGKEVLSSKEVQTIIRKHKPGEKVGFLILRKDKLVPLELTIGEFPDESGDQ